MPKINLFLVVWSLIICLFYSPVFRGLVPIPLDTLIGLYHPWRDNEWNGVKNVPFKNFLITDPIRQQIPLRYLSLEGIKNGKLSQWNPYSFSGTPLTANIQTGFLYPMNIIFFILPFAWGWTALIIISSFMAGLFMYFYLRNLNLKPESSLIGALTFSFSGFMISWLEWGTIPHVVLWLPLIFLAIDKLFIRFSVKWLAVLTFSQLFMLLAGHLQLSFYIVILTFGYLVYKSLQHKNYKLVNINKANIVSGSVLLVSAFLILSIQYIPLFKFIAVSARSTDLNNSNNDSWFIPLKHLVQFIAPDFFGNPGTLNYWGVWNYGEFVGYIGLIPLIFALYTLIKPSVNLAKFFGLVLVSSLLLATKNPLSIIPFKLNIPWVSTGQPSRLLILIVFSLSILASLGIDAYMKKKEKYDRNILFIILALTGLICILWLLIFNSNQLFTQEVALGLQNISKRNLILPTLLVIVSLFLLGVNNLISKKLIIAIAIVITIFDLLRFQRKYISFSPVDWFYPQTQALAYLKSVKEPFRILTTDRRILPPNVSAMYKLEEVGGYDPLYLTNYARLIQSWNDNRPNPSPGAFNRIITPLDYNSFIADLLNVRYILTFDTLDSSKLQLVFQEGETKIYENMSVFPRIFLAEDIKLVNSNNEALESIFNLKDSLRKTAVVENEINIQQSPLEEQEMAQILSRSQSEMTVKTVTNYNRLLVFSEIYAPGWHVKIDEKESIVYKTNFAFRGVVVPKGEHKVSLYYNDLYTWKQ